MIIAVPILTALGALGALSGLSRSRRWLVPALAGLPYLAAAWYVQAAFRGPSSPSWWSASSSCSSRAGEGVRASRGGDRAPGRPSRRHRVRLFLSRTGVAGRGDRCWLVAEVLSGARLASPAAGGAPAVARGPGRGGRRRGVAGDPDPGSASAFTASTRPAAAAAVGTVGGVQLTGPLSLGNLPGPLYPVEALGIWLTGDFRFPPANTLVAGMLVGLALLVLVFAWPPRSNGARSCGLPRSPALRRVPLCASLAIPYVAAKAWSLRADLALGSGLALMDSSNLQRWRRGRGGDAGRVGGVLLPGLRLGVPGPRRRQVNPVNHQNELRSLRPLLHGKPTLVLFYDDYAQWELLGQNEPMPQQGATCDPCPRPWAYGQPYQFDSVPLPTLDLFDYVIATRTNALSQPPPNFQVAGGTPSFVDQADRTDPAIQVLPASPPQPGALLDCNTATGTRISRRQGFAEVRTRPSTPRSNPLVPNQSESVLLKLPAGRGSCRSHISASRRSMVTGGRAPMSPCLRTSTGRGRCGRSEPSPAPEHRLRSRFT